MLFPNDKKQIYDWEDIGPDEKSITKEIDIALKLINEVHLKSAIHLISGNIIIPRVSKDPENVIRVCEKLVLRLGVARFFQSLSNELLAKTTTHCHLSSRDALIPFIHQTGIVLFLKEKITTDVLREYCIEWKNFDNSLSHADMVEYVTDEIMFSGMEKWLEQFPRKLLEDWCTHLNIVCKLTEPDSIIIEKIMSKMFINKLEPVNSMVKPSSELTNEEINQSDEDSVKRTIRISKRKHSSTDNHLPKRKFYQSDHLHNNQSNDSFEDSEEEYEKYQSKQDSKDSDYSENDSPRQKKSSSTLSVLSSAISKTTTKEELDCYIMKDLQLFCRENNLSYVGRKSELISRIITFIQTGEKPHKRKYNRRKR